MTGSKEWQMEQLSFSVTGLLSNSGCSNVLCHSCQILISPLDFYRSFLLFLLKTEKESKGGGGGHKGRI